MVHPFLRFTIKGVVWYQGEANAGNYPRYVCSQKSMIEGWRSDFNNQSDGQTSKNFPFGLVQVLNVINSLSVLHNLYFFHYFLIIILNIKVSS